MRERMRRLASDESGAVTVDWVVLTAAIVGLGLVVTSAVAFGTVDLAQYTRGLIVAVGVDNGN